MSIKVGKYRGYDLEEIMIDDEKYIEFVQYNYWQDDTPMEKLQKRINKTYSRFRIQGMRRKECIACHKKFFGKKNENVCVDCFIMMQKYENY